MLLHNSNIWDKNFIDGDNEDDMKSRPRPTTTMIKSVESKWAQGVS